MAKPRVLVLIGSGETAAQMTRGYRMLVDRLVGERGKASDIRAAIVDTPYRFQENAPDLSAELLDFFGRRIGMNAAIAAFGRADEDVVAREAAFERVRQADFVFSGPGSPTYALRQWSASALPGIFADKVERGGILVFASAAALTIGRLTVPVYEIYKGGDDPYWLNGLDVLASIGVHAAVLPHFDNNEGRGHDTRFCFLGERRLRMLEEQMPADTYVLGIDEHTALLLDIDAGLAVVHGRGRVTIREGATTIIHERGAVVPLAEFQRSTAAHEAPGVAPSSERPPTDGEADLARRLLELETAISTTTARAELVEPLLTTLVEVRRVARERGDYESADAIRDALTAVGIELTDEPDGTTAYLLPD